MPWDPEKSFLSWNRRFHQAVRDSKSLQENFERQAKVLRRLANDSRLDPLTRSDSRSMARRIEEHLAGKCWGKLKDDPMLCQQCSSEDWGRRLDEQYGKRSK